MPDIILKNREGLTTTYSNVEQVVLKDTNGNYVYYSLGGGTISVVTVLTLDHYTDSHAEKLATITNPTEGDFAIIKAPIEDTGTTHWEYTSYVYQEPSGGTAYWQPMDGNYSLDNIYFKDNILATTSVGYLQPGTIATKGKSMSWLVDKMLTKVVQPTATNPSASCSISPNGSEEVGTQTTVTWSASFSPGSFTYGPATGCKSTESTLQIVGGAATTLSAEWVSESGIIGSLTYTDSMQTRTIYISDYGWTASTGIAVDSIGNPASPAITIAAAEEQSTSQVSQSYQGYRKMFWGYINSATYDSDIIRELSSQENGALSAFLDEDTTKYGILIAAPKDTRTLTKVTMPSSQYAEVTGEFSKQPTSVKVKGANDYASIDYDVWIYHPAIMAGTYQITMS